MGLLLLFSLSNKGYGGRDPVPILFLQDLIWPGETGLFLVEGRTLLKCKNVSGRNGVAFVWPGAGRCKELLMMCPLGVMSRGARNFWAGPVARPMLFFITRPFGLPCVSALATFCLFYTYLPQALAMHVWFFFFHTEMDTVFWGLP